MSNARRMRGSYGDSGVKRESSAPYPVPRMGNNSNSSNGPGLGGVPSPLGAGMGGYVGQGMAVSGGGTMQTVTLDQVAFQRRPTPTSAGYQNLGGKIQQYTI